ncbi:MAG: Dabb family protein [Rikenellaceae bacterium]
MLKHIVMWRLKENALGKTKQENSLWIKESLEALVGQIPELISAKVGINANENELCDVVLVSEVKDFDDLKAYATNPLHVAVGAELKQMCESRIAADYWE